MKTKVLLSFIFAFWFNELFAYPSLFYTDQDMEAIHEKGLDEKTRSQRLYLSALIYLDQNHWCLWVNHKIMRPETSHSIDGFHLERVMPHEVTFSWIPQDSTMPNTFTLRPSQTYVANEQKIVAGGK